MSLFWFPRSPTYTQRWNQSSWSNWSTVTRHDSTRLDSTRLKSTRLMLYSSLHSTIVRKSNKRRENVEGLSFPCWSAMVTSKKFSKSETYVLHMFVFRLSVGCVNFQSGTHFLWMKTHKANGSKKAATLLLKASNLAGTLWHAILCTQRKRIWKKRNKINQHSTQVSNCSKGFSAFVLRLAVLQLQISDKNRIVREFVGKIFHWSHIHQISSDHLIILHFWFDWFK